MFTKTPRKAVVQNSSDNGTIVRFLCYVFVYKSTVE